MRVAFTIPAPSNHLWGANTFDGVIGTDITLGGREGILLGVTVYESGRRANFVVDIEDSLDLGDLVVLRSTP